MAKRVVLVTGASRGLGAELCLQYARAGWSVIAASRSGELAPTLTQESGLDVSAAKLDIVSPSDAAALAADLDARGVAISLLVNNAGVALDRSANLADVDYALWEESLKINVLGAHRVTAALLPALARSGPDFKIACLSSRLGSIGNTLAPLAYDLASTDVSYRTSKAAVNMAVACIAVELRTKHPQAAVVALCPGWVKTDMGSKGGKVKPPLEPPAVCEGLRKVIADVSAEATGSFINWQSEAVPW